MRRGIFVAAALLIGQTLAQFANAATVAKVPGKHKLLVLNGNIVKWGRPQLGAGAVVTYAWATSRQDFPSARNCRAVDHIDRITVSARISQRTLQRELAAAFAEWEGVANIRFQRIDDMAAANIVIGSQVRPRGRAFANVTPLKRRNVDQRPVIKAIDAGEGHVPVEHAAVRSLSTVTSIGKSLVCVNPAKAWKVGFNGDLKVYDLRYTFIHEIGHAIGLDHPGARGEVMDFKYSERFRTLRAGDIAGAIRLYGPKP